VRLKIKYGIYLPLSMFEKLASSWRLPSKAEAKAEAKTQARGCTAGVEGTIL
jgi:hypothetical protein